MENKIELRITFQGKDAERFLVVKEDRGVVNNTELPRVLVSEAYRDINNRKSSIEADEF